MGLPLKIEFSKIYNTIGFDIDDVRINDLKNGIDKTGEVENTTLKKNKRLFFTSKIKDLKDCNVYIITVPTPVTEYKTPD